MDDNVMGKYVQVFINVIEVLMYDLGKLFS